LHSAVKWIYWETIKFFFSVLTSICSGNFYKLIIYGRTIYSMIGIYLLIYENNILEGDKKWINVFTYIIFNLFLQPLINFN